MDLRVWEYYQCSIHTRVLLLELVVLEMDMSDTVVRTRASYYRIILYTLLLFISVYKDCGYMDIADTAAEKSPCKRQWKK